MQNKGAIRLVAIALALVSLYQLSFTYITGSVRREAVAYAQGDVDKQVKYLDSIGNEVVYNFFWIRKYTYKDCMDRELNLGLDLKGGMNVILEVSVVDLIKSMSNNSQDSTFLKAIDLALKKQKASQEDFVTLFGQSFKELNPSAKLASVFNTIELKDKINFNSTNDEVLEIIRTETRSAIDNSFNILRTRIDRFGVTQPNIQELEGRSGLILVELPGVKEPERVRKLLQGTANLEFWETYDVKEIWKSVSAANDKIKEINEAKGNTNNGNITDSNFILTDSTLAVNDTIKTSDTTQVSLLDNLTDSTKAQESLLNKDSANNTQLTLDQFNKQNPLFAVLRPNADQQGQLMGGAAVGFAQGSDTAKVNQYLAMRQIKELFPRDLKFLWSIKPVQWDETETIYELVAIKVTNRDGSAPLSGDAVVGAREEFDDQRGTAEVTMTMNGEGAKVWARLTKENIGRQIAIVLDNYVYSYPTVQGEIKGGNSSISGNFTITEAKDLANVLKSGKLPAKAQIIEEAIVGPSLGQEAITSGLASFVIAFVLVLMYMILYYKQAGLIANIALIANLFFLFGVLASLGAVLTLPGIAGIVLTMGMAVDANVIIYERIKEELRAGKGIKLALKDGYNNAYSAIIDGNVTTLLTGIILYIFGHGPIQGFATTLVIGILTSMFSAIFISRLIFQALLDKNKNLSFANKYTQNILVNANFKFIEKRKIAYVISGIFITISIISLFTRGLNQGIDFVGGRSYIVTFDKPVSTVDISSKLTAQFGISSEVKTFGADNQIKITTKYRIDEESTDVDRDIESKLFTAVAPVYNANGLTEEIFLRGFVIKDGNAVVAKDNDKNVLGRRSSQKVGPTIADDIKVSAVWAILLAFLVIFIYIFIRFKNWQYGMGGVVALIHDSLVVLGVFSLFYGILPFSLEVDQAFIAAILTVVGYSINDTVIVFDRIREALHLHPKRTLSENMNYAINSTLPRTLNTSFTTLVVIIAIFLFGGEVIRGFVFALLVGIGVGTYSSIFVASPLAYETSKKVAQVVDAVKTITRKKATAKSTNEELNTEE